MQYPDREEFKKSAHALINGAQTPEARVEGYLMLMEAHYHRNPKASDFQIYAAHWLAANEREIEQSTFNLLVARFPTPRERMIADGYSDWGSYGDPSYKRD